MAFLLNEGTTARYTATLVDEAGAPVPGSRLTSLRLTWYDRASGTIINGRNRQECVPFGAGRDVAVGEDGRMTWQMTAADVGIVNPASRRETHVALFEIAWAQTRLRHEAEFGVVRMRRPE